MQPSETKRTLKFIFILCFTAAIFLSILATLLKTPQERAKELNRIEQMLLSAQILSYSGTFQIKSPSGEFVPAIYDVKKQILVVGKGSRAKEDEIFALYNTRVNPSLVNDAGELVTFDEAKIDFEDYLLKNERKGFANLPLKLIYLIYPNLPPSEILKTTPPSAFVIPINGFGLWDAIYGYLALEADADTVLGTTWYKQAETAGLGANIALPSWQKQFYNKVIFQPSADGVTHFETASLGITVIKGNVNAILANSIKAKTSVDGISGATITGKGVTDAYSECLAPYRPFLLKAHNNAIKGGA